MKTEPTQQAPPATDAELVMAAVRGENACYGELVERYKRMLYGIAWSRTGNADLSEDVVQDAFLQAYRYLGALRHPEKFPAWLARIARNLSSRAVRNARREQIELHRWAMEQPKSAPAATPEQQSPSVTDTLQSAMADLGANQREALVLFYLQGKSVRAAAAALGISEAAYKTRLHRARQALKGLLEQRLETALGSMHAPSDTRARVMSGIAAVPVSSGVGAAGILFKLVPGLLNIALVWGWIGWVFRHVSRNYRSGAEMRRKVLWHNYAVTGITVAASVAVTLLFMHRFGMAAFLWLLTAYMGVAAVLSAWQVRITPHPLIRANTAAYPVIAGTFLLIALGWLPFPFFMVGFIFLNVLTWRARKDQPFRQDYNLFLRAAMGGICDSGERIATSVTREQMLEFARMLGVRMLVIDRAWRGDELRLYTGFVRMPALSVVLPLPARLYGASYVEIAPDGTCIARLEAHDSASLTRTTGGGIDRVRLETQVAAAVQASLARFVAGNHAGAVQCVEADSDDVVFAVPPHRLKSVRALYIVGIVGGILALMTGLLMPLLVH